MKRSTKKKATSDGEWDGKRSSLVAAANEAKAGSETYTAPAGPRHPPPKGRYDLPLSRGGPIALLMEADLAKVEDVEALRKMHNLRKRGAAYATVDQLRSAQEIGLALNEALFGGDDPYLWKLIGNAHAEIFTQSDRRCAAIHAVEDAHSTWQRSRETTKRNQRTAIRVGELAVERIGIALRTLHELDDRFKKISQARLQTLLASPKLRALGIATKLSLECGAFGDSRRAHESDAAAQKRVKRNYEKAIEHARKAQVPS